MTLFGKDKDMSQDKTSIILISDDTTINDAVCGALLPGDQVSVEIYPTTLAAVNGKAVKMANEHDLIVFRLNPDTDPGAVVDLRKETGRKGTLLALSDTPISLAEARNLKKAGIDEILPFPLSSDDLRDQLLEMSGRTPLLPALIERSGALGQVIAVAPVRGGIGASTVAANLADQLQAKTGLWRKSASNRVALVDLDIQFGTLASALDINSSDTFYRLATEMIVPDRNFLAQSMEVHASGLTVLTAPDRFAPLDALDRKQIDAVIGQLQREYDFVVVDMPRTLVEWIAPIISRCARLLLVTDTSVPSIRQARRLIDFYTEERLDLPVDMIVNREKKPFISSSSHAEAAKVLDRPLKYWLPDDRRRARAALDRGQLLSQLTQGGALLSAIRKVARKIATETTPAATERPVS
jgi:Flp pilus assembly CpaE family ATPase